LTATVRKEGAVTLSAKHIYEIVKGLPGEEIHLTRSETQRVEIRAGKVEFRLLGLPDRDFPRLPDHREVKLSAVEASDLTDMIGKTVFAASSDETRPHLCAVLFEVAKGRARMVATDGHRLAKIEREWKSQVSITPPILVPRRGIVEIQRHLEGITGSVELGVHQAHLFVRTDGAVLSVKLADAAFPPYEQVVPSGNDKVAILPRLALLEALRRVSLVASDRTWGVKFELAPAQLRLASDNPDLGDASETVDAEYSGAALTIGFNARYLIDLLSAMSVEKVRAELAGELDAALLRPNSNEDYVGVVMPMRI